MIIINRGCHSCMVDDCHYCAGRGDFPAEEWELELDNDSNYTST